MFHALAQIDGEATGSSADFQNASKDGVGRIATGEGGTEGFRHLIFLDVFLLILVWATLEGGKHRWRQRWDDHGEQASLSP
jgi:hypothetical protein